MSDKINKIKRRWESWCVCLFCFQSLPWFILLAILYAGPSLNYKNCCLFAIYYGRNNEIFVLFFQEKK